jgi:hypothetical protein
MLQLRGIEFCEIDEVYKETVETIFFLPVIPVDNIKRNMAIDIYNEFISDLAIFYMILVDWEIHCAITDAFDGVINTWFAPLGDIGFFLIDVSFNLEESLII